MPNPVAESWALMPNMGHSNRGPALVDVVESWHNSVHAGGFRVCDQQPCHAINFARRGYA